ncbi:MAG: hypothetical protein ACQKBU_02880, partial [Verrucomicrobiales bacterium]
MALPQDLSDLEGWGDPAASKPSRDLKKVLANAIEGGYALKLSEEDLNLFLRDTLVHEQGGLLAEFVDLEDVAIRLEDDRAEVVFKRRVLDYPVTVSMFLRIEQTEQPNGRISTQIFRNGASSA